MDDETKNALLQFPKQYAERLVFGNDGDFFLMSVFCGRNVSNFALSPKLAKRVLKTLSDNIDKFEKRFGKITGEWDVPSPFEVSDLLSPNKNQDDQGSSNLPPKK